MADFRNLLLAFAAVCDTFTNDVASPKRGRIYRHRYVPTQIGTVHHSSCSLSVKIIPYTRFLSANFHPSNLQKIQSPRSRVTAISLKRGVALTGYFPTRYRDRGRHLCIGALYEPGLASGRPHETHTFEFSSPKLNPTARRRRRAISPSCPPHPNRPARQDGYLPERRTPCASARRQ